LAQGLVLLGISHKKLHKISPSYLAGKDCSVKACAHIYVYFRFLHLGVAVKKTQL